MELSTSPERPRKRRAINACTACRTSKVRCDGNRPCKRCTRNDAQCVYYDTVKDPSILRIEKLEAEVASLRNGLDKPYVAEGWNGRPPSQLSLSEHSGVSTDISVTNRPTLTAAPLSPSSGNDATLFQPLAHELFSSHVMNTAGVSCNAVEKGLITWDQATFWFQSFFSGSHYFVPIFCEKTDNLESVSSRSPFLFDVIVSIGCRAEQGLSSSIHHRLQSRLREHLTNILITTSMPSVEMIQAITVMAGYSENGFVMIALALRFALQLGLSTAIDQLMAKSSLRIGDVSLADRELYRLTRVWHGICNLELFFSLDGGKLPGVTLRTSSRRIRALIYHSECTQVDVRLFSQIELNIIRSNAYINIINQRGASILPENEDVLRAIVHDTSIELSLWLEEWTGIISTKTDYQSRSLALLNIQIQHEWALITLHLKALSDSGIENIALMNDFQQDMVRKAKDAAARHLQHLLQGSSSPTSPSDAPERRLDLDRPAYLTTFKWTMDYVWAKCAFSVLLVLKLALLLRDPLPSVMLLLRDAHKVLEELKKITTGHIAYFQILQTSIEKCESALREYLSQQSNATVTQIDSGPGENRTAEDDFQGYAPSEFVFEWDFPGLNLRHMPLGWHDLFIDLDNVF